MTDTGREIIDRQDLLDWLDISDSTERRKRKEGHPWPPHLFIGNKVYYRRGAVEEFLQAQEAACRADRDEPAAEATQQSNPTLLADTAECGPLQPSTRERGGRWR